mmetsp:Transcript_13306/g.20048  ORF Transcript_13306/g.20048 Transcript_13306/m.20048 type:complete len:626 (+) Transcript_13306:1-1878(+)
MSASGTHIKQDIGEARRLLNLAANIDPTGMSAAIYELSRLEANISNQVRVLQQAIALGNTSAKVELAKLLRSGAGGVQQDFIKAEALLKEAMEETSEPSLQEQFQAELKELARTQVDFMEAVEQRRIAEEDTMIFFKRGRYEDARNALDRFVTACTPRMSLKEYKFCESYFDLIGEKATASIQLKVFENAIETGLEQIVKAMLSYDRHNTLFTDMHQYFDRVLFHGHAYVLEVLLDDIRMSALADNLANQFAFVSVVEKGFTKCVRILLRVKKFNPAISNNRCIKIACQKGFTRIVELLLKDRRVDPSVDRDTCIRAASRFGYTQIVSMLLSHPKVNPAADISWNDIDEIGALQSASEFGHAEIVRLLLCDKRCIVNSNDNYAIKHASANGHALCVQYLLERKLVDPSAERQFAIRSSCRNGHSEVVSLLLSHPSVDLSIWDYTPIKDAILLANINVLSCCLPHLSNLSSKSQDDLLDCVFNRCHPQVTKLFLESPNFSLSLSESTYLRFIHSSLPDSDDFDSDDSDDEDTPSERLRYHHGPENLALLLCHPSNPPNLSSFIKNLFDTCFEENKSALCDVLLDFDRSILHEHAKKIGFLRPGRILLEAMGKYPNTPNPFLLQYQK